MSLYKHLKKEKIFTALAKMAAAKDQPFVAPEIGALPDLENNKTKEITKPLTEPEELEPAKPISLPVSNKSMTSNQSHSVSRKPGEVSAPQKQQHFTPIPNNRLADPMSKMARNTGIVDIDGNTYINGEDVELLGKLGFVVENYCKLEKTSEVLDLYSYIEKVAGVPKSVAKAVDKGEAFSGSFLEDMEYSVPKGYEIKGDLCCPKEKKAEENPPELSSSNQFITHHSPINMPTEILAQQTNRPSGWNVAKDTLNINDTAPIAASGLRKFVGNAANLGTRLTNKLNKFVPGVGIAVGEANTQQRLAQNVPDTTGAAIDRFGGVAGAVPLVGTALSLGATAVNTGRDFYNSLAKTPGAPYLPQDKNPAIKTNIAPLQQPPTQTPNALLAKSGAAVTLYDKLKDILNKESNEKTASEEDYVFTHYNPHGKHKELRPLTYLELLKDRSRGRWENKPELAQKYVDDRKEFEATLGKELLGAGLPYDSEKSFLYGAVDGHERFGQPGAYQHLANMPDLDKTFFTINGLDDKDHIGRGKQGLLNTIKLWKENRDKLKDTEYMGMTIRPRVEIMTQECVTPHTIKRLKEKTAAGRCWEGYKPVPGKEPYSDDSCKPVVAKKKKESELEKEAEYKWHKSKDLHRDVTNGRHYPFSFLTGEAKELVDAIKNRDIANFKEEIGDTTYAAQMLAAQATGLNHPVLADLSKFYKREKAWKDIFNEKGGTYHPKHMEGGSNYAKPSKIIKAFASAGIKINQTEAERIADKYTGGNMEKEATHELKSSNIKAVGYDKKEKELEIHFHSGGEYKYSDVPASLFHRLLKVKSPGKFFHKHIKRDKPFEYEKVASLGKLMPLVSKGLNPLFHAVSGANTESFIKQKVPKIMSASEGIARNLVHDTEAMVGQARQPGSLNVLPALSPQGAHYNHDALLKETLSGKFNTTDPYFKKFTLDSHAGRKVRAAMPGHVGAYANEELLTTLNPGGSKNWGTVSFSPNGPLQEYGNVGLVANQSKMPPTAISHLVRADSGEVQLPSRLNPQTGNIHLPAVEGKIFYIPGTTSKDQIQALIAQHGRHNVVPWNRANRNRFSYLTKSKKLQNVPVSNSSQGNIPSHELAQTDPNFAAQHQQAHKDLINYFEKDGSLKKIAGATPERIRELILKAAKGCKESSACLSRMSASRKGKPAPRAVKVKPATVPTNQPAADAQGMLPFAASHEFELAKNNVDPTYKIDPSKYLGKQGELEKDATTISALKSIIRTLRARGLSEREALSLFKQAAPGYRTNSQIGSEINNINANPIKTTGSAAVMDFPQKGVVPPKLPAYTPNNEQPHQGPATYLESIPALGHFIGPPARMMEHDPVGAGLGLTTDALAFGGPIGLAAAGGVSVASKVRDMSNYLDRKADIAKKIENTNRPVQG